MTTRPLLLAFALTLAGAPTGAPSGEDAPISRFESLPPRPLQAQDLEISVAVPRSDDVKGDMARPELDLAKRGDLAAFKDAAGQLSRLAEGQHAFEKSHPERVLPFRCDLASSGKRRALREMIALADLLLREATAGASRPAALYQLLELHHALDNSFRYPLKKNYEIIPEIFPILLLKARSHRSIERDLPPRDPSPLSEGQILQALLATSMSAAEVRLALEKLLSKRQKMVADFGLSSELREIARRRIDTSLEFDPAKPDDLRAVTLSRPGGASVVPERGDWVIQKGHLVRRVAPVPQRAVSRPPSATMATGAMKR